MLIKKQKTKVLCIGSAGKDIFFPVDLGDSVNASMDQERLFTKLCFNHGSKIHIKNRFIALGGCASNVSVGLSRLGVSSSILTLVGDDSDGEWIKEIFLNEKVETANLKKSDQANTDISVIVVDSISGERTIFVSRDVGEKLQIEVSAIQNYKWCFMGSLYGDEFLLNNVKNICDGVDELNMKLAYNPGQSNILHNPQEVCDLIKRSTLLFVNKDEGRQIVELLYADLVKEDLNSKSEEDLLKMLFQEMGDAVQIVLTNGIKGAWGYDGDEMYYQKASEEKALDATGGGDAFTSGFFATILQEKSMNEAMKMGSKNSKNVIKFYGAQEGLLSDDEIL